MTVGSSGTFRFMREFPIEGNNLRHLLLILCMAAQGYFGRLIFQCCCVNNRCTLHFVLVAWSWVGIGSPCLGISSMAFQLNGVNFNPSILDGHCRVISSWADVICRANLGMDVMHVLTAPNFSLDLV